ncbi:MAG TPA: DUF445 domain-containing protein, partial [Gemmatimonadaceae bacterium]|nr:DUF445 domain-containing protein [Gemmatimonadaceae bacterium]
EGTLMPLTRPDDDVKQAQLDRMKRFATGLLVAATVIFAVTRILEHSYPWLGFIRATAEAAMIGGLADWFAVTALFRHPMGLPIPHTAIVAKRKDRIGRTLGNFVQNNFLSRPVLQSKLDGLHLAERGAQWLAKPANAQLIARQVAAGLARTAEAIPEQEATRLIAQTLSDRVRSTKAAPLLGNALLLVASDGRHQELLDDALRLVAQAVDDNRELIRIKVLEESPWWVPGVVDERIYQKILSATENLIHEVRSDPNHPLRSKFDLALAKFIDKLRTSPEMSEKAEAMKGELLGPEVLDELAETAWRSVRDGLVRYASREAEEGPGALERGITSFAEALLANQKLLSEIDDFAIRSALTIVEQHRHQAGELISHTVSAWDPDATSQRIELAIGRDLQFIRINGTIVGGLAGLVIYIISRFL